MVNKENLKTLVKSNGGLNKASKLIGLSSSGLHRLINGKRGAGSKTIEIFADFCKKNNLELADYIFFG